MLLFLIVIAINTFNIINKNNIAEKFIVSISGNKFKGYLSKLSTCPVKILISGKNLLTELADVELVTTSPKFEPTLLPKVANPVAKAAVAALTAIFPGILGVCLENSIPALIAAPPTIAGITPGTLILILGVFKLILGFFLISTSTLFTILLLVEAVFTPSVLF